MNVLNKLPKLSKSNAKDALCALAAVASVGSMFVAWRNKRKIDKAVELVDVSESTLSEASNTLYAADVRVTKAERSFNEAVSSGKIAAECVCEQCASQRKGGK